MNRKRITLALVLALGLGASVATASDRWLHVRIQEHEEDGARVSVNVPLSLVQALIPAIETEEFYGGRVHLGSQELDGIDLREVLLAVRDAPDAEYVTIDGGDETARISKERGMLLVDVDSEDGERVRVRLPLEVVEALLVDDGDELDLAAGLEALARHGGDIVTVESENESVRIWIDSSDRGD